MADMSSGLQMGQKFPSLEAFRVALRALSVTQRWGLRMVRSEPKRTAVGCRTALDCPFRVICRLNKNADSAHITTLEDTHTCRRGPMGSATRPPRAEVTRLRFLLEEVPKLFDMTQELEPRQIVDAVK